MASLANQKLWASLVAERDHSDVQGWWYISGWADAKAGYERDEHYKGGTVNYLGANPDQKAAYDLGYLDGCGIEE